MNEAIILDLSIPRELYYTACIAALVAWGVAAAFWEEMIFAKVGDWWEKTAPEWLYKVTIGCVVCMAFWWGAIASIFILGKFNLFVPLMAMGINAVIVWMKD